MAENITTLLDKPDAENVSGTDYLYLVQGTGSDRDRKIALTALFASDPAHTLVVDGSDTNPGRYLIGKFSGASLPEGSTEGDVDFAAVTTRGGRLIVGVIGGGKVTTGKIAEDAVTNAKIADGAVSNGCLADNSVSTGKIIDGNVTTDKLAAGAVTAAKIADGNVTPSKLDENESYEMAGLTISGRYNSVTMTEQSVSASGQGALMADGIIDHGYQLLTATGSTYDLTSNYGSGDDTNLTHVVALYNSTSGPCTVTIDSPAGGGATKTVLLSAGNVGLFMKIGWNAVSPVFAPVSFSSTVS